MKYKNSIKGVFIAVVILLFANKMIAQPVTKIQLLDKSSLLPITEATYQYGGQKGITDKQGFIEFQYSEGLIMQLSHINYGKWELPDDQIRIVIRSGVTYRESKAVNLYPVTVIAMRAKKEEGMVVNLDYQDKMAHDGGSLLNQSPAINSIRKSGSYGFDPVLRGFKYDQLNVVLNGAQSATAACPNRMDPPSSQMAPNMLDRIEILKGPHALRYGTGFGGTINFVPAKLRFSETKDIYGRLSGEYGHNGNISRSEGMLGFSGKKFNLGVFASWSQGGEYESGNGSTIQSDFLRSSFGTNLGFKISSNQQLKLSVARNLAQDVDFPALGMDLREDDTWMFSTRYDINLNKKSLKSWNTTFFGSFVDHLMDNLSKSLGPRMVNAETFATTYNYGGRTEGNWSFKNGTLYTGLDLRIEGAEGTREREFLMGANMGNILEDNAWQKGQINKTGLFSEVHIKKSVYQFVFSGRLELNNSDISGPSPEFGQVYSETQETQVNPSISLGALRNLNEGIAIGLWLGRAQRSGSLTERFINYFPVGQDPYEMLGNPQLEPEVNNQIDLTFKLISSKYALGLDAFAAYLQNSISSTIDTNLTPRLPSSPGVRQFVNIDKAFKTGFEVNLIQELFAGLLHQISIAYTYGQDLEKDEPLPEIAPMDMRYSLRGRYMKNKLRPELNFRYVLEQSRISNEFGETKTPSFSILDLKLAYQVTRMADITIGVNNLLNNNYYEHLNRTVKGSVPNPIYAPGINFFGSFNFTF